jgi:hypothetical protein
MRGRTTTHARQDKVAATNTLKLAAMKEMNEPRGSSTQTAVGDLHRRLDDTRWPSEVGGLMRLLLGGRVGACLSCGFIRASDGFARPLVSTCL